MSTLKRIAVDVMGGDYGPSVTVPAALKSLAAHSELFLVLVGDRSQIEEHLSRSPIQLRQRLEIVHTSLNIGNNTKPESVLRKYKDSSMYLCVDMVKDKRVDACVSAGNTGALLLTGRHLLKTIPGISKPAIIATVPVPTSNRRCYLLDVGANINTDANQLVEFAVMGSVLASALDGIAQPRIGLLNIGQEEYKGTEQIRLAAQLLEKLSFLNYIGFVEGNEIFSGRVDVVVCDGFVGNVTIKTSAGVVKVISKLLQEKTLKNWLTRIAGKIASPLLRPLTDQINPARYNGASLLGLQGIIVKSHGNALTDGFFYAIEQAVKEVIDNVPELISQKMAILLASDRVTDTLNPLN